MVPEPTTPTRDLSPHAAASSDESDTFEDAPDLTPRPRTKSPEASRSLTERRTSAATIDKAQVDGMAVTNGGVDHHPTIDAPATHEEEARRISMSGMDEVNLGDGAFTNNYPNFDKPQTDPRHIKIILDGTINLTWGSHLSARGIRQAITSSADGEGI